MILHKFLKMKLTVFTKSKQSTNFILDKIKVLLKHFLEFSCFLTTFQVLNAKIEYFPSYSLCFTYSKYISLLPKFRNFHIKWVS